MKRKTNLIYIFILLTIIVLGCVAGYFYFRFRPAPSDFNITEPVSIYIDEKKDYYGLLRDLESVANIKNLAQFKKLASAAQYKDNMLTGRYVITPTMSCADAFGMFLNGRQTPVQITFNNIRLKSDFAEKVGSQFMFGSESLLKKIRNPFFCEIFGFDTTTIACIFIPNTYEMYWNTSEFKFIERMKKEYERFWTAERLEKANAIPLTPVQVAVLASIVEEETSRKSDYPIIAGLYINRLRKNMLLQADPTVKFAVGNFSLRRILYRHLNVNSPYNTYKYPGLPPGPIRFPSIAGMDSVLNYTPHNYLFMTAKEDLSGGTNFAVTHAEHVRNARKYQATLNRNRIR
ncbi:MAG: endolytic transglycosylase MltG [Dysgonamonadaceae bacterium]|jgi:UPF0755 protein|nr:endolytic transglycosylase MltG [Dysgonamonadaceae bacterium]